MYVALNGTFVRVAVHNEIQHNRNKTTTATCKHTIRMLTEANKNTSNTEDTARSHPRTDVELQHTVLMSCEEKVFNLHRPTFKARLLHNEGDDNDEKVVLDRSHRKNCAWLYRSAFATCDISHD